MRSFERQAALCERCNSPILLLQWNGLPLVKATICAFVEDLRKGQYKLHGLNMVTLCYIMMVWQWNGPPLLKEYLYMAKISSKTILHFYIHIYVHTCIYAQSETKL